MDDASISQYVSEQRAMREAAGEMIPRITCSNSQDAFTIWSALAIRVADLLQSENASNAMIRNLIKRSQDMQNLAWEEFERLSDAEIIDGTP